MKSEYGTTGQTSLYKTIHRRGKGQGTAPKMMPGVEAGRAVSVEAGNPVELSRLLARGAIEIGMAHLSAGCAEAFKNGSVVPYLLF